jgi:tRNA-splicing ligase RtcB
MPIGGVAGYSKHISPAGVGFDIACGNKAVKLNLKFSDIEKELLNIAQKISEILSFGIGRKNNEKVEHELFNDKAWSEISFLKENKELRKKAEEQLGTIGSGNHYVDVFRDEEDFIWIGVHFGSRGFGHAIATEYIKRAGANPNGNMDLPPALLLVDSVDGKEYIEAMRLAGIYAYAGRDWVCSRVAKIIGGDITEEIHNHHNFAWKENHFGKDLWVVRKGATPAFPSQKGFVGASMGENAVILEGIDSETSKLSMYSTMHGAGRVMSRTQAAGKSKWIGGKKVRDRSGLVHWGNAQEAVENNGTILIGGGADEAPEVYKRLPDILELHKETIKILHELKPIIVVMAGENEFDPYKD